MIRRARSAAPASSAPDGATSDRWAALPSPARLLSARESIWLARGEALGTALRLMHRRLRGRIGQRLQIALARGRLLDQ